MTRGRRRALLSAAGAVLGIALFAWAVDRAGVDALSDAVRGVGWGLIAILAIGGLRFAVRAQCWRWCLPAGVALDFPHAFSAFLAGDAVGNVTPLGLLASEPAKVLLVRHHLATLEAAASLTIENIVYAFSVLVMLGFGLSLLLVAAAVPETVRWAAAAAVAAIVVGASAALLLMRVPGPTGPRVFASGFRGRVARLVSHVSRFALDHPGQLGRVFGLELLFHALAVWETYLTLGWLLPGQPPGLVQAVLFETVNRLTTVLFKFVPFRIGVDEAASGALASVLAATATAGVALAVVRRVRVLFWSAVGLLLVATHPATSPGPARP